MPTEQDIVAAIEQGLSEGKSFEEAAAGATAPAAPPGAPPQDPVAPPAAPAPGDEDIEAALAGVPEPLRDAARGYAKKHAESERRKWESGATEKFQRAKQHEEFLTALRDNPEGVVAWLAGRHGLTVTRPNERPAPGGTASESPSQARLQTLRDTIINPATSAEAQLAAFEEMADIKAEARAAERVRPMEQVFATDAEERLIEEAQRDFPDVNVRALRGQMRELNQTIQKRPYLLPRESTAILMFPAVVEELRRFKAAAARPNADAEKARAAVAGPSAGTPKGSFDPTHMTVDQLERLMGFER